MNARSLSCDKWVYGEEKDILVSHRIEALVDVVMLQQGVGWHVLARLTTDLRKAPP